MGLKGSKREGGNDENAILTYEILLKKISR